MPDREIEGRADRGAPRPALDCDRFELVLFDLDGTLVDSLPDLLYCANEALATIGYPARDAEAARGWVGNGVERFVKRALTGDMLAEPDPVHLEQALQAFNRFYADNVSRRSLVYPGAIDALQRLARLDLHLGCVTNKPEPFTSSLLRAMGLLDFFELVVAGDTTVRKKPDPMPLHYAADRFGLKYENCLMVGDSSNDVSAARAAGFAIACVPYGYNHGRDIAEAGPDLVVEDLSRLADFFTGGSDHESES